MNNARTVSFDRVADTYDATRALPEDVMALAVDKLAGALERHDCRTVLDAGVGTGRFAAPLQRRGFEVCGLDVSREMLEKARVRPVTNLFRGDLRRMPFQDRSFDAAIAMHVLHLIKEWREALRELGRVARTGLFSVVSIPDNKDWPSTEYRKLLLSHGIPEPHQGIHERDLILLVPPTESENVTTHIEEKHTAEVLDNLDRRIYSFQWDVPEDVHRHIMGNLRERYTGRRVTGARELRVCFWDFSLFR